MRTGVRALTTVAAAAIALALPAPAAQAGYLDELAVAHRGADVNDRRRDHGVLSVRGPARRRHPRWRRPLGQGWC